MDSTMDDRPGRRVEQPRMGATRRSGQAPAAGGAAGLANAGRSYDSVLAGPFEFGFPFRAPERATVRREVVAGRIWSFEQVQGLIYVHVPVRMTVVKLDAGGLFVYAPVAPTGECLRLLEEVEAVHGHVRHILLPTVALEHKYFAGSFARARPDAQLWVAPAQYSFPADLPLWGQGFPLGTRYLPDDARRAEAPEWAAQLPYKSLGPFEEKVGKFQEVVCFDRASSTLLVTDLILSIPEKPPEVLLVNDDRALRYHSRDTASQAAEATDVALANGWRKICLFALYFQSSPLEVVNPPDGSLAGSVRFFNSAFPAEVPAETRALGWNGFIAWRWKSDWRKAFETLRDGGKPLVPPILQVAILNREPRRVLDFVQSVVDDFPFRRIIPCHFDAEVIAGPREFSEAFNFLRKVPLGWPFARRDLPPADLAFLREFEESLLKSGIVKPAAPRV